MSEDRPLINVDLGDITKPAVVLIEKISDAIGAVFLPSQIKRIAQAEAEAGKIRALGAIKISDIQKRALFRMIHQEEKRQKNIEQIIKLAIQDLRPDAKPEDLGNDWLAHFFDKSQIVSDAEMQSLWGKLLAREANDPRTFSRRTVELVSTLGRDDALLFTDLCKFGWSIEAGLSPVIYDKALPIYQTQGINFGTLTHLDDIGLITFNDLTNFKRMEYPKKVIVAYYGRRVEIEFSKEAGNDLKLGKVMMTQVGAELSSICRSTPADGFFDYVRTTWEGYGYRLSLPPG
ncbi:MAG: DUF2806 domain-containing protein [Nitrospirales bacterium]